MLLKKGSKGNDVITLQKFLNLTADGDFGAKTETAVKDWQSKNNLVADGVVGDITWNKMFGNSKKGIADFVIYDPLKTNVTHKPGRPIKYLVIHYTAGASSVSGKAAQTKNVWKPSRPASADFVIDDTTILQANPDLNNYYCWACGEKKNPYSSGGSLYGKCLNSNSISIEMCSTLEKGTSSHDANHAGWSFTKAVEDNTIKLAKVIMEKFNIPIERVIRHYDVSGKLCPGIVGWNNETLYNKDGSKTKEKNNSSKWEKFKNKLV